MFPPAPMQGVPLHFLSASYSPETFLQTKNCLGCVDGQKGLYIREVRAYDLEM